tara:strand:+ start:133 stop:636 length:504 start_codon:yes stop_codon:yes gene_type:complete
MNFLHVKDELFTPSQCKELINKFKPKTKKNYYKAGDYFFYDFDFKIIEKEVSTLLQEYRQLYPAIDLTFEHWRFTQARFKYFPPGHFFAPWHVEHGMEFPLRVAGIVIYLSTHKTGTEFFTGKEHIISQMGRAIMYPTAFTHAHRGHPCPEKKDRYILTTYADFFRE